jgi:hypothetical protein
MFWAQPEDDEDTEATTPGGRNPATTAPLEGFVMPP